MPSDSGWEHSVAGGVAGSAAVLLLHPFDVIKTRLQVQDGYQGQLLGSYQGSIHAVRTILKREGWRAFYNGLIPAWIGSGVAWSAYFTAYEAIKSLHARRTPGGERPAPWTNTVSAAAAGAMVCLLTNPIWLVKTRLQLQNSTASIKDLAPPPPPPPPPGPPPPNPLGRTPLAGPGTTPGIPGPAAAGAAGLGAGAAGAAGAAGRAAGAAGAGAGAAGRAAGAAGTGAGWAGTSGRAAMAGGGGAARQYKGFIDALVCIGRQEGWKGYYKGLGPSLVLTTHGAIQFTVYEEFKHAAARWGVSGPDSPDRRITTWETSIAAAASKLTSSVITYPSQVIRSRLQQRFDLGRTRSYKNAWEVIRLTWKGEGLRGFYKGLGPALVRVMPQSAVTLVIYENVLQFLMNAPWQQT